MARSERSIIKGMQQEHDRLVGLLRQSDNQVARLEGELAEVKDDQIAALVEAAIQPRPNGHKWCALCGMWAQKDQEIDHSRTCVLADLPAAARERATEASPRG